MSPRAIRRLVVLVFVSGIAGMIVGSIADNNGVAITFGLLTAAAAVGLILVTAVAGPGGFAPRAATQSLDATPTTSGVPGAEVDDERAGAAIEDQVAKLVAAGVDEADVRELVRRSVAFGRHRVAE